MNEANKEPLLATTDPAILLDADGMCLETNTGFAKLGLDVAGGKRFPFLDSDEGSSLSHLLAQASKGKFCECHLHIGGQHPDSWRALLFPMPNKCVSILFISSNSDLAYIDVLTGLPNRRDALHRLEHEWARMLREKSDGFSLGLVDIDNFKLINDRYGHEVGDQALRAVAKRLQAVLRRGDWCARWGGEEFLLLLYSATGDKGGLVAADRTRASVCSRPFISASGSRIPLAVSIGVVYSTDYRESTIEQMVSDSDMLMYEAKRAGRNCTVANSQGGRLFWPREDIRKLLRSKSLQIDVQKVQRIGKKDSALLCMPRLEGADEVSTMRLMRSARLQEMMQTVEDYWFEQLRDYLSDQKPATVLAPLSSPSLLVFERLISAQKAMREICKMGHRLVIMARGSIDIASSAKQSVKHIREIGAEFGLRGISLDNLPLELIETFQPVNIMLAEGHLKDMKDGAMLALKADETAIYMQG